MAEDELTAWARGWLQDRDARRPWQSFIPPDGLSLERAYALQDEVARLRAERGERVIGYKIGCTSRLIQDQLGIRQPIFARVFDSGCFPSHSRLDHGRFANLAIEGELAIRLSRDVPPGPLTEQDCSGAVETLFPVIELHDFHLPPHDRAAALIASGGMHAGLVLAERETKCSGQVPMVAELDVAINDRFVGTTAEPWTMGGASAALQWLSARLADRGLQLLPGQLILTGSALPLFPVGPGSRVVARARPLGASFVEIL